MTTKPPTLSRVADRVPRWLEEVPLYRRRASGRRCREAEINFIDCFQSLPLISKQDIRSEFPHNFLRHGMVLQDLLDRELVELERTSGTSEEATPLLLEHGWWNEQEQKALRLNRWIDRVLPRSARRVTIASPSCTSEISFRGTPTCQERVIGQSLFVNLSRHPFLWSQEALHRMVEETLDWRPDFLDVDPVYGVLFARHCEENEISIPGIKFVLSSYEYLSHAHRQVLERVFGVPVVNLYGSTETGHLLMEDEHGRMRPSHATAYLELVNEDEQGIGQLVVTTLANDFMPLIRYDIGDLARKQAGCDDCPYELHGRARDAILDASGNRVTVRQVDDCFASLQGVLHYQLRQTAKDQYHLSFVPQIAPPGNEQLIQLRAALEQLLHAPGGVRVERGEVIPCDPSGKFRLCQRAANL